VRRGGNSLAGAYRDLLLWLAAGIVVLAAIGALIAMLRR
jgi:hypothetical protein